jgi:hypothetical protein
MVPFHQKRLFPGGPRVTGASDGLESAASFPFRATVGQVSSSPGTDQGLLRSGSLLGTCVAQTMERPLCA